MAKLCLPFADVFPAVDEAHDPCVVRLVATLEAHDGIALAHVVTGPAGAPVRLCVHHDPAVAEAAVVGIPDAQWGERLAAVIVPRPGRRATPDEIMAHCRQYLGGYKVSRLITFTDELPRNPAGKVMKRTIRDELSTAQG